jgi:hypothetical protein
MSSYRKIPQLPLAKLKPVSATSKSISENPSTAYPNQNLNSARSSGLSNGPSSTRSKGQSSTRSTGQPSAHNINYTPIRPRTPKTTPLSGRVTSARTNKSQIIHSPVKTKYSQVKSTSARESKSNEIAQSQNQKQKIQRLEQEIKGLEQQVAHAQRILTERVKENQKKVSKIQELTNKTTILEEQLTKMKNEKEEEKKDLENQIERLQGEIKSLKNEKNYTLNGIKIRLTPNKYTEYLQERLANYNKIRKQSQDQLKIIENLQKKSENKNKQIIKVEKNLLNLQNNYRSTLNEYEKVLQEWEKAQKIIRDKESFNKTRIQDQNAIRKEIRATEDIIQKKNSEIESLKAEISKLNETLKEINEAKSVLENKQKEYNLRFQTQSNLVSLLKRQIDTLKKKLETQEKASIINLSTLQSRYNQLRKNSAYYENYKNNVRRSLLYNYIFGLKNIESIKNKLGIKLNQIKSREFLDNSNKLKKELSEMILFQDNKQNLENKIKNLEKSIERLAINKYESMQKNEIAEKEKLEKDINTLVSYLSKYQKLIEILEKKLLNIQKDLVPQDKKLSTIQKDLVPQDN